MVIPVELPLQFGVGGMVVVLLTFHCVVGSCSLLGVLVSVFRAVSTAPEPGGRPLLLWLPFLSRSHVTDEVTVWSIAVPVVGIKAARSVGLSSTTRGWSITEMLVPPAGIGGP